jgi:ABC-2 type transport system permease protein
LIALTGKELRTLLRAPALMFVLVYVFVVHPWHSAAQYTLQVKAYPIAVHDLDQSGDSRAVIESLRAPLFGRVRTAATPGELDALLARGDTSAAVVIPAGFGRQLRQGGAPAVEVTSDGTYAVTAQLAQAYLGMIVTRAARERGRAATLEPGPPVEAAIRVRYNPALVPEWFRGVEDLFQGALFASLLIPAALTVRERERGTIEQLLVSPARPWEILAAKVIPMILVAVPATAAGQLVLSRAYGVPAAGSMALFLAATALTVFATSGLGLLIAAWAGTLPRTLVFTIMLLVPIQFLSGHVAPVDAMPRWQQIVTLAFPQRYYFSLGFGILFKGATLERVWGELLALALLGAALFAIGARGFLKRLR